MVNSISRPVSPVDELRSALELATEEELQELTDILFRPKFNPLDYVYTPTPLDVQRRSRLEWLDLLEERFRFLAADGMTVLRQRSHSFSYRQTLEQVCHHLKISYSPGLSTEDLESEVFLVLLERVWCHLSPAQQRRLSQQVKTSLKQTPEFQTLPKTLQTNPLGLLAKGTGALAVSSVVRPWLLRHIARQFALHLAKREVAKQALLQGGTVAIQLQNRVALSMASRGMAINAARYGATRTVLACVGPVLWGWFLADLGWRAIATNYGRIIPVVFALAQIRLLRATDPVPRDVSTSIPCCS